MLRSSAYVNHSGFSFFFINNPITIHGLQFILRCQFFSPKVKNCSRYKSLSYLRRIYFARYRANNSIHSGISLCSVKKDLGTRLTWRLQSYSWYQLSLSWKYCLAISQERKTYLGNFKGQFKYSRKGLKNKSHGYVTFSYTVLNVWPTQFKR